MFWTGFALGILAGGFLGGTLMAVIASGKND